MIGEFEQCILDLVCKYFAITLQDLTGRKQRRHIAKAVEAKQVAAYLIWKYSRHTNKAVATMLGYKAKQTVTYSRHQVKSICSVNKSMADKIQAIEKELLRD